MFWNDPNLYGVTLPYKEHLPLMWQNYPRFVPPTHLNYPMTHNPFVRPDVFRPDIYAQQWLRPDIYGQQMLRPDIYGQQMFRPDIYGQQMFRPDIYTHQTFRPDVFTPQATGFNPFFTQYGMVPSPFNFYRPFI